MSGNSARGVGRLAFTAVGYYVGGLVGAPAVGGAIGGAIGSALFPHQLPDAFGPRLEDLLVQTSAVGVAVPIVYGTYAIAGNVIWADEIQEVSQTEEVGKGGGTEQDVTTYTYFGSFAVGLCEGEIAGVTRIWANEELVYDVRPQQAGETTAAYNQRMAGSTSFGAYMTVYAGTETQIADPTIEAVEGAGEVPAYRGLAYLVFDALPLADFYNRVPNLRVEVSRDADEDQAYEYSTDYIAEFDFTRPNPAIDPAGVYVYRAQAQNIPGASNGPDRDSFGLALEDLRTMVRAAYGDDSLMTSNVIHGYGETPNEAYPNDPAGSFLTDYGEQVAVELNLNKHQASGAPLYSPGDNDDLFAALALGEPTYVAGLDEPSGLAGIYIKVLEDSVFQTDPPAGWEGWAHQSRIGEPDLYIYRSIDSFIRVERVISEPPNPCFNQPLLEGEQYCVIDGDLHSNAPWIEDTSRNYKSISIYEDDGVGSDLAAITRFPFNPALPDDHPLYDDEAYWTAEYQALVDADLIADGRTYSATGLGGPNTYPRRKSYGYYRAPYGPTLEANPVTLSSIVSDLCGRAALTDIDVSDLASTYVTGYAIGSVMAARDALQPLRQFAQFDGAEIDGQLVFAKRGGAAVATLTADDLSAHAAGGQRPAAITVERTQDVELPRKLRVKYASTNRDYEPGEQYASRLTTDAVQAVDVQLPIAMSDTQAAQIAEILLFESWTARNRYQTAISTEYLALTPGDAITLPVEGTQERARVLAIDYAFPGVLTLEAVRDDDGAYVSYAVGNSGNFRGSTIAVSGPTEVIVMDLPALRDSDDTAGYYAAMRGTLAGWRGATLMRSDDGGASFAAVASSSSAATMGAATTALADAQTTTWDRGNTLTVALDAGSLEGITEAAVLAGGNAAALEVTDSDGETLGWEIIQFAEAAHNSDGAWTLSDLLRGRRGTEWATAQHSVGDRFVLLTGAGIVRVPMDSSGIGIERPHRAVTFGTSVGGAAVTAFTGLGTALEPYSVAHVAGDWSDGDLVITWIRRGRIGQELRSGADIPLSEESEAYEVDVMDGETVLRTFSASIQTATYTAAQIAADFGSPTPESVTVRIYQLSATVGRGFVSEATL